MCVCVCAWYFVLPFMCVVWHTSVVRFGGKRRRCSNAVVQSRCADRKIRFGKIGSEKVNDQFQKQKQKIIKKKSDGTLFRSPGM